jgi:TetR/AcrR family acrAB operon transcriptional repressor
MRRTKDDAEKTRHDILKAALKVFSKKGYTDTNLQEIAECAGVTRGAIYWHFNNKATLYHTLIDEANSREDIVIEQAIQAGGTFKEMCKRIMVERWLLLEEDSEYREIFRLVMFNTGIAPELVESRQLLLDNSKQLIENVAAYMRMGIESGQIRGDRKPLELSHAYLAYQQGVAVNWLQDPKLFSMKEMASVLADIFIEGM